MTDKNKMSRKDFMKTTGKAVAGVAAVGAFGGALTGCASNEASAQEPAPFPYEYKEIDPDEARERAYRSNAESGWGTAVAEGIFGILADEHGYPYNQVPTDVFATAGGGYGAKTLCGSLGVAATVISFFAEPNVARGMISDLFAWYEKAELPIYEPDNLDLEITVADSLLCEDSVGKYLEAEGVEMGDPERVARCGGLAADVTGITVEMLNEELL